MQPAVCPPAPAPNWTVLATYLARRTIRTVKRAVQPNASGGRCPPAACAYSCLTPSPRNLFLLLSAGYTAWLGIVYPFAMADLTGKRLLLGITGGIAAYKAAELVRLLTKDGADVQVVMTDAACRFITPATMQALSGKPVFLDMWGAGVDDGMPHIELTRGCDLVLVAPATADFLAKLAHGLADDLLSALCLARDCPLIVAPAMNRQMWENPATRRNMLQLREDGIGIVGPDSGEQACGEVGAGRMVEPVDLHTATTAWFRPKILVGVRVLITAGPTFEPIDTVRGITNRSSGRMGFAVARAAREAGAEVTLICGPTALEAPRDVERIRVETAQEMMDAVLGRVDRCGR